MHPANELWNSLKSRVILGLSFSEHNLEILIRIRILLTKTSSYSLPRGHMAYHTNQYSGQEV